MKGTGRSEIKMYQKLSEDNTNWCMVEKEIATKIREKNEQDSRKCTHMYLQERERTIPTYR